MKQPDNPTQKTLTKADLPEIIQRYRKGESLQAIAAESPVKVRQLYNWIFQELGPDYAEVQTECFLNRVADADAALEKGGDAVQIARARETARFARMDLERRRPHLYGQKMETKSDTTITVIVQRAPDPPTIDVSSKQIEQAEGQANPNIREITPASHESIDKS